MRSDGRDFQSALAREIRELAAKIDNVIARVSDVVANLGPKLDHRLMHLRFDLLFEQNFALLEDLLNVRPQFARLRIDNRELFLNSESVSMRLRAHGGLEISAKNSKL